MRGRLGARGETKSRKLSKSQDLGRHRFVRSIYVERCLVEDGFPLVFGAAFLRLGQGLTGGVLGVRVWWSVFSLWCIRRQALRLTA